MLGLWSDPKEDRERISLEQCPMDRFVDDRETERHCLNRVDYGFDFGAERVSVINLGATVASLLDLRQRARAQAQRVAQGWRRRALASDQGIAASGSSSSSRRR